MDLKAATQHGILACNSPAPENFKGVPAATVGYIFMLGHRQKHKEAPLRAGPWGVVLTDVPPERGDLSDAARDQGSDEGHGHA